MSIIDRITPDESHLPPSARTWARLIRTPYATILEIRDPNDGPGDPALCARYQYLVARQRLWSRRLSPAPLDQTDDRGGLTSWALVTPRATSIPWRWATECGVAPYVTHPTIMPPDE